MITAREAMTMALAAEQEKVLKIKNIALETIEVLEALIRYDAHEGHDRCIFYLYNYHNFISEFERKVYRNELTKILETNGYHVKYNHTGESLEIRFF